jgi:hypothetical protein
MLSKEKLEKLKFLLEQHKSALSGEFIKKNSSYEADICTIIAPFKVAHGKNRYFDCTWEEEGVKIEFKKGGNYWINIIRYCETLLGVNAAAQAETYSLFFIPDEKRKKIIRILGVESSKIKNRINVSVEDAQQLLALKKKLPRNLNAQMNLTPKDVRNMADFIIDE